MSIRTNKMLHDRSSDDNCILWLPLNEASGTTVYDAISGDAVTLSSADYNTPHAVGALKGGVGQAWSALRMPAQGAVLTCVKQNATASFGSHYIGDNAAGTGAVGVSMTPTGQGIIAGGGSTTIAHTEVTGGNYVVYLNYWDETTFYGYLWENAAEAGVSLAATGSGALPSGFSGIVGQLLDALTLGIVSTQPYYGITMFDFSANGIPTNLVSNANQMAQKWMYGEKTLVTDWTY